MASETHCKVIQLRAMTTTEIMSCIDAFSKAPYRRIFLIWRNGPVGGQMALDEPKLQHASACN